MEELTDKVERRVKRSKEIGANIEENLFKQLQSYHNFSNGFIWKLLGLLLDTNSRKQNMFNSFKDLIQNKKPKMFLGSVQLKTHLGKPHRNYESK